jgi:hypothetical protein
MEPMTVGLRVTTGGRDQARVSVRRHQFVVGRPIDFDVESATVMALEYALGALGAELVGGLNEFAGRRRLVLDNVEALVQGEIEDPLVYLEVIGESGQPRIRRVDIKVYVDSPETEPTVRQLFEDVLARLPLVGTFRGAVHLDIQLILAA